MHDAGGRKNPGEQTRRLPLHTLGQGVEGPPRSPGTYRIVSHRNSPLRCHTPPLGKEGCVWGLRAAWEGDPNTPGSRPENWLPTLGQGGRCLGPTGSLRGGPENPWVRKSTSVGKKSAE